MIKQEVAHLTLSLVEELDLITSICAMLVGSVPKTDLVRLRSYGIKYTKYQAARYSYGIRRTSQRNTWPRFSHFGWKKMESLNKTVRRDWGARGQGSSQWWHYPSALSLSLLTLIYTGYDVQESKFAIRVQNSTEKLRRSLLRYLSAASSVDGEFILWSLHRLCHDFLRSRTDCCPVACACNSPRGTTIRCLRWMSTSNKRNINCPDVNM